MKTDDLIAAMAADARTSAAPIATTLSIALVVGALVAALAFSLGLGPRADALASLAEPRFLFKFVLTLTLLGSAAALVFQLARPGTPSLKWLMALALAPMLLAIASFAEMWVIPPSDWKTQMVGTNAFNCVLLIPALAAAPLVALLVALRRGATTHPVLAGAVAGLVSASVGATLYGTHCPSDSPLFLAAWYVIAITFVTLVGARLGASLLRW
jgi:hypothetical protein